MILETQEHVENTRRKLDALEHQISLAKARTDTPENRQSIASLVRMANQLREDIVRCQARYNRRAS